MSNPFQILKDELYWLQDISVAIVTGTAGAVLLGMNLKDSIFYGASSALYLNIAQAAFNKDLSLANAGMTGAHAYLIGGFRAERLLAATGIATLVDMNSGKLSAAALKLFLKIKNS